MLPWEWRPQGRPSVESGSNMADIVRSAPLSPGVADSMFRTVTGGWPEKMAFPSAASQIENDCVAGDDVIRKGTSAMSAKSHDATRVVDGRGVR